MTTKPLKAGRRRLVVGVGTRDIKFRTEQYEKVVDKRKEKKKLVSKSGREQKKRKNFMELLEMTHENLGYRLLRLQRPQRKSYRHRYPRLKNIR